MEWWSSKLWNKAKPFAVMIALQFGYAGMSIITKFALNDGLSQHVLVVYRHIVATAVIDPFSFFFDRKHRPKMTPRIFFKITMLGLLEYHYANCLPKTGQSSFTFPFSSLTTLYETCLDSSSTCDIV